MKRAKRSGTNAKTAETKKKTPMPEKTVKKKTPARQSKPSGTKEKKVIVKIIDPNSKFPEEFPFWARLKISKNRTTLVIDEKQGVDKKTQKPADLFVHREATHTKGHGEAIIPNPDKNDPDTMYLRSPWELPKQFFKPHNKQLDMPESLKKRYGKKRKDRDGKKE